MMNKTIDYYMGLPYSITLHPSPEGGYAVAIPELPGCITQADTAAEALTLIEDAKKCWLESCIEDNVEIPEPTSDEYSGRFNVRVPKSLHRHLSELAKKENISLNQLILYHLSMSAGFKN
jgi:antitoxin HicB